MKVTYLTPWEISPVLRKIGAGHFAQPYVIVCVATLDENPGTKPTMHIWCSHDVPWLQDDKDVSFYQEWQSGR